MTRFLAMPPIAPVIPLRPRAKGFEGRVLHATPSFAPAYRIGGPVRSLEGLVRELSSLGVDVKVLTTDSNGGDRLEMPRGWTRFRGVPVRYLQDWASPLSTPAFAPLALFEAKRARVVHVTGLFSMISMQALAAALLARRPVVLSPRGTLQPGALEHGRRIEKRAFLRAFAPLLGKVSVFHATSEEERRSIQLALGHRARVAVVPNGAEIADARLVDERRAAHKERPRIAFLGRVHPIKAIEELVSACAILRDRGLDFELRIAGPFPDRDYRFALRAKIRELSLEDRVSFEGELLGEAKDAFYASSRVFVLPSRSENFGNVVVEALACRTPVVASLGTPWRELEERRAGRWVRNDPLSLADAIEVYLRDRSRAEADGERGRRLVEERYTWRAVAEAMRDVYAEASR